MANAVERVRRFRHLRALIIGDAILDTYLLGTAERLCVEGPVPVVRKQSERRLPGGAANTAANLRALGASVTFLSVVGCDSAGAALREMLTRQGVDDRWLLNDDTIATQHKLRIIADGQYVVRFDEGATRSPSLATRGRLREGVEEAMARCDVVIISDYCYGAVDDALIAQVKSLREQHAAPLVVDSKQLARFRNAGVFVVTPNLSEARALVSAHAPQASAPPADMDDMDDIRARIAEGERLAHALLDILHSEIAVVTMAADGVALAARDGRHWHVPAYPVARPNDVGAGDSFTSALALALAAGAEPGEAAHVGVDAAGIAVSKRFTSHVERHELLQRVSLRESAADGSAQPWSADATTPGAALRHIQARLDLERAAGRVIVFTNGVFDVLHAGHIAFLRQAKALGDTLVVGVNSDASVERQSGSRPSRRTTDRDRLALLSALEVVDYALLFDDETPARLIRALRPHVHAKGGDYADETLPETEAVRAVGGRVVIVPLVGERVDGDSTHLISLASTAPEPDGDHAYAG